MRIEFEWDLNKAQSNLAKHGISFEEAIAAFSDQHGLLLHDPDHSNEEDRFILLGMSARLRLLVVVHTYRRQDRRIRIISARKATKREETQYKEAL